MPMVLLLLAVMGLISFLLGVAGVQPATRQMNWVAMGLAFFALIYLLR